MQSRPPTNSRLSASWPMREQRLPWLLLLAHAHAAAADAFENADGRWMRAVPSTPYRPDDISGRVDAREYGSLLLDLHKQLNASSLRKLGQKHSAKFGSARPFSHIALDGVFPDAYLPGHAWRTPTPCTLH